MSLLALLLFLVTNIERVPRTAVEEDMSVAMPVPVQLLYSAGDRFLAANVGVWRAIMVGVHKLPRETVAALARIQDDASLLNPAHEDNYYTAAAILSWEGEVEAAQRILDRATNSRPSDVLPPFFFGFNRLQFFSDPATAARYALIAARHATDEGDRQALTVIAARWSERGSDPRVAAETVRGMAASTRNSDLKRLLLNRAERLERLADLRVKAAEFERRFGKHIDRIEDLVASGMLKETPLDPLGDGYVVKDGEIVLLAPGRGK